MWKRVFSSRKQVANVSKSIRCTTAMWEALEQLAKEAGETPNAYIILILDQYLQVQLENGAIKPPPDVEETGAAS